MKALLAACLLMISATLAGAQLYSSNFEADFPYELYNHNGSKVALRTDENVVEFTYLSPRAELPPIVERGVVLFTGIAETYTRRDGVEVRTGKVSGIAYTFRRGCNTAFAYEMSGNMSEDGERITLFGEAPRVIGCRQHGTDLLSKDSTLYFTRDHRKVGK